MRQNALHLKFLIFTFLFLGITILFYQIFILKTPIRENQVDNLWTIDAKISFEVKGTRAVNIEFFLPAKTNDYQVSDEIFLANNYGQNIINQDENRMVIWSARALSGKQSIFYRTNIIRKLNGETIQTKGEIYRQSIVVTNENEKNAIDRLTKEIRSKSSNTSTFITTAINLINDSSNGDVKLLLKGNNSTNNKIKILEVILSQAHIPIQQVHTLILERSDNQTPKQWIRSYIESTPNKGSWQYFNPIDSSTNMPENELIWWIGENPLLNIKNGVNERVSFSIDQSELTAIELSKLAAGDNNLKKYSFYTLPITTQFAYQTMLMIPFGVLVILILRNIIGINSLGTFTPVLIALAFRETGLGFGILFFSIVVSIGLLLRSYLEHLKLQMLPRLSIVLTFVVCIIIFVGLLSHKLGFEQGLSITLFPMVILTMTIERLSITWDERGANFALKVAFGTMIAASLAFLVMGYPPFVYFVFTFPAILLILVSFMLAMGRYRGYRLFELFRFKAMAK